MLPEIFSVLALALLSYLDNLHMYFMPCVGQVEIDLNLETLKVWPLSFEINIALEGMH